MIAVLIGYALLVVGEVLGKTRPDLELRAGATWLVPWLIGLTLVSYLGDYGGGTGTIGFGAAIPILFVFSLAIYLLAYRVRLDPSVVEEHIEETRREVALEESALGAAP